jgi:serine/threonine protein kinase
MIRTRREADHAERSTWGFLEGDEIADGIAALRKIGGGHKHEVYLGWHERMYTSIVVKLLRPSHVEDAAARAGFARELDLLRRLDHPLIVRAFGGVIDGARPHVVLEHIEGPRLSTLLRKYGTLPWEQLIPLAVSMGSALHYLRAEGVVHLDVKPSNIVMDVTPRLIDFSVARAEEDARTLDHPVGTDAYMSPEQCAPSIAAPVSFASDVWGLGATLYQTVAGETPFANGTGRARHARWPQVGLALPPGLADEVPDVIAEPITACLEPDPRDRPSATELGDAFAPLLAALPRRPVLGRKKPRFR